MLINAMPHRMHFVVITVVIGILIYFYFVHKELRVFDSTLNALRQDVRQLKQRLALMDGAGVPTTTVITGGGGSSSSSADIVGVGALQQQPQQMCPRVPPVGAGVGAYAACDIAEDNDDDDDDSVTSNDIKDILTNITHTHDIPVDVIRHDDAGADTGVVVTAVAAATCSGSSNSSGGSSSDSDDANSGEKKRQRTIEIGDNKDLRQWDRLDMARLKYDDLRNFLRKHGIHMKGTKDELIEKIMSLPK